ncbi:hypothetical protein Cgig2_026283 [Carnegiea gigantea]|uniref:Uncharacterized protein n=1 Tax=Carnegiea gigantea TaxID=171969 RepID=A0A9Q1JQL9_9CARY|nr:hypothetical protein Cgig2_026283 [Carnegiea gigantea]
MRGGRGRGRGRGGRAGGRADAGGGQGKEQAFQAQTHSVPEHDGPHASAEQSQSSLAVNGFMAEQDCEHKHPTPVQSAEEAQPAPSQVDRGSIQLGPTVEASHSPVQGGTFGRRPEIPQSSTRDPRPSPVTKHSTSNIQARPVPGFSDDRIQPSTDDSRPSQATGGSSSRSLESGTGPMGYKYPMHGRINRTRNRQL